jgi:hypothetical protein
LGAEDFDQEEAGADDDAGVGYVEVGPVVVDDGDFEEVDDVVEADAIVEVGERSAEDEGEGDGGEVEGAAGAPQHGQDDDRRKDGEGDESPADGVGREGGEQREGRAVVEHMSEAEDVRNDGDRRAGPDVVDDPGLGEAVEQDDDGREDEECGAAVFESGIGHSHWLSRGCRFGAIRCRLRCSRGSRWRRGLLRSGGRRWGTFLDGLRPGCIASSGRTWFLASAALTDLADNLGRYA